MVSDKLLSKMPRSNKKKGFLKPLAKIPVQSVLPPNNAISELMASERKLMISRAILTLSGVGSENNKEGWRGGVIIIPIGSLYKSYFLAKL